MRFYNIKILLSLFILLSIFMLNLVYPQQYGKGLLIDEKLYKDAPKAISLLRGDYSQLPLASSLKRYCPIPGDQGGFSTCVSWATSYGARTILAAVINNWDRQTIIQNTFSPTFVYNIADSTSGCKNGISLFDGLEILKHIGTLKEKEYNNDCNQRVSETEMLKAFPNKILEYRELFWRENPNKILLVKKSIAEEKPVVIGMDTPFTSIKGDIWNPKKSDYNSNHSAHAMVVISYDDQKYGGAFEILNSWGNNWANNGFVWIRYSDFDHFTLFGFELIDKSNNEKDSLISGTLSFIRDDGKIMEITYNDKYFIMKDAYNSGTKFQVFLSNDNPAYIYSFGTDLHYKITKLFPVNSNIVAYIPYPSSNFAIPGEDYYLMLDSNPGKTYFVFLYSLKNFNIKKFLYDFEMSKGNIVERVNLMLKDKSKYNDIKNIQTGEKLSFKALVSKKDIIPIIVEIQHK